MKFKVTGQRLEVEGGNIIAEGAVEFASFTLECDASWNGFSKTVRFRRASSDTVYDVAGVIDKEVYYIPSEVLARGSVYVSVLGVSGEYRISTTEFAGFFVEGSIDSGKTPTVTPDAYAQYVALVSEKCENMAEVSEDVKKSFAGAQNASEAAKNSETLCLASVSSCASYAEECRNASRSVSGAENSMNAAVESVRDSVTRLLSREHEMSVSENGRVASENQRKSAETERAFKESNREKAEEERAFAEAERVASERGRVAGESLREKRVKDIEDEILNVSHKLFYKAPAILGRNLGSNIVIDDAAGVTPLKFSIIGSNDEAVQPSREAPIKLSGAYGNVSITLRGKNMLPYPYLMSKSPVNNEMEYEMLDDGGVKATGKTVSGKSMLELTPVYFILDSGRYVVSGGTVDCGVFVYDIDKGSYIARSNGGDAEFKIDSKRRISVRLYVYAGTSVEDIVYPMLRLFSTNSEYAIWKENKMNVDVPRELFSVKNTFDSLVLAEFGNTPRLQKNLAKYTFNGSEDIYLFEEGDGYNTFVTDIIHVSTAKVSIGETLKRSGMCSHLPYGNDEGECCFAKGECIYLKLIATEFPDVASLTMFLERAYNEGAPVEVLYTLETPIVEKYDSNLNVVLNEGVNILECDGGVVDVKYIRDTNSVFESIIDTLVSLDARVSILEV